MYNVLELENVALKRANRQEINVNNQMKQGSPKITPNEIVVDQLKTDCCLSQIVAISFLSQVERSNYPSSATLHDSIFFNGK